MADERQVAAAVRLLTPLAAGEVVVDEGQAVDRRLPVSGGAAMLADALRRLDATGVEVADVGLRRPTLDDVFLSLTGHAAEASPKPRRPER